MRFQHSWTCHVGYAIPILVLLAIGLVSAAPPKAPPPAKPSPEIKRLMERIEKLKKEEADALAKAQARYLAQAAALNLPAFQAEIHRLAREEHTALWRLLDPAKVAAIHAKYRPEIQALEKQIKGLESQIATLTGKRKAEMAKIRAEYGARLAKLDPSEDKLERRLARAIAEERAALYKLLDRGKAATIRAEFDPGIAELKGKIRSKEWLTAALEKQKRREIAVIEAVYRARRARADGEGRLDLELVHLLEARRYELEKATDTKTKSDIHTEFDAKIADLKKRIREKKERLETLTKEKLDEIAAIERKYGAEIAKINVPENRFEGRLASQRADEKAALHKLIDSAKAQAVRDKYQPEIDRLKKRIAVKEAETSRINAEMRSRLAAIEAEYRPQLAKLDAPDDKLEHKLARLKEREHAEIRGMIDRAQMKDIHAKYDPPIEELIKHLRGKERELAQIGEHSVSDMHRIMRDYHERIEPLHAQLLQLMVHGH